MNATFVKAESPFNNIGTKMMNNLMNNLMKDYCMEHIQYNMLEVVVAHKQNLDRDLDMDQE